MSRERFRQEAAIAAMAAIITAEDYDTADCEIAVNKLTDAVFCGGQQGEIDPPF